MNRLARWAKAALDVMMFALFLIAAGLIGVLVIEGFRMILSQGGFL